MRILCLTPSFQHPNVRGPHRYYYFVRELSKRNQITLLTLAGSDPPADALEEMASYTERILTFPLEDGRHPRLDTLLAGVPGIGPRFRRMSRLREGIRQMKCAFDRLIREESFDLLLFHGKSIYPVIEDWAGLPLVVDFCDATSSRIRTQMRYAGLASAPRLLFRYLRIKEVEEQLVRKTRHLGFVSYRDREAVLGPDSQAKVLPIGVDIAHWQRTEKRPHPSSVVLHGTMDYAPNNDAALYLVEKIVPLIRRSIPDLVVSIVGRSPSPALLASARRSPNVTVTGPVEDVRPFLERAAVYAAPLRFASGIQNKILEAMAMSLPVVTTSIAAAGLRTGDSAEPPVLVADDAQHFASRIIELLRHEDRRDRLATEGRRFVESHFVWPRIAEDLERLCIAAVREYRLR